MPREIIDRGTSTQEEVARLFDSLEPASAEFMIGSWKGAGLNTGHPMDGLLEAFGWHGKRFESTENVHPLVYAVDGGRLMTLEPQRVFAGMGLNRVPGLAKAGITARAFRLAMPLMSTTKPAARLRIMEYRGQSTATMVYDRLPINDHFVRVDDDTVLGVMDLRGLRKPFWFSLKREI